MTSTDTTTGYFKTTDTETRQLIVARVKNMVQKLTKLKLA